MALTDAQVDTIWRATVQAEGCQWYGDQTTVCGETAVPGKHYCSEHLARAYIKGSAISGKRKAKQLEAELRELEMAKLIEEQQEEIIDESIL